MPPRPCPATAARVARPLLIALALAWPGGPAWAQDINAPPLGHVPASKLAEAQEKLRQAQAALAKAETDAKAARQAAEQAQARAARAEQAATEAQANKATPDQLAALRKERDKAVADGDALRRELAQAQDSLKRLRAAAAEQAAAAADLDKLRRQTREQQATIDTLRGQLAAKDKAQAATAAAPRAAPAPAAASATGLPPDLSELSVPGCGDACPTFVLLPNPGPVTLGTGSDAIRVDFRHRMAMASTETTVGQWKAFISDSGYRPVKTDQTYCNWNDGAYASQDRLPVRCVNVADAEAYAAWFAAKYASRLGLRIDSIGLPSELEFEFAARGGRTTQAYLWPDGASDAEKCRHAQIGPCEGRAKHVVGRLPNGYRLHDMIGNVWEWTASPWRDQRSALPAHGREALTGVSGPRALRGASFGRALLTAHPRGLFKG